MLRMKEQNGVNYYCCPNCSRMYPSLGLEEHDRGRDLPAPSNCIRCSSPMDIDKALEFADAQAITDHIPELALIGDRMRGTS